MGKNSVLDDVGKVQELSYVLCEKHEASCLLLIVLCSVLFFCGCAFPRVVILEDPLTPEEHLNLGVIYEKNGELDSAINEYELAAEKHPVAYLYLGNANFQKNRLDKAEGYFKQAIKKVPHHADAYNNLAWLYYVRGENLHEAENLALKAMGLNPCKNDIYGDTLEKIRELIRSAK